MPYYAKDTVTSMNYSYPWNGCITTGNEKTSSGLYELHATGDADLNGRKYVALPKGLTLTDDVKRKYNLM